MLLPLLLATAVATEPITRHLELAEAATAAERAHDPATAIALCREAEQVLPEGPKAARCDKRIAFLEARRDPDGGFVGWTTLQRARSRVATDGADVVRTEVLDLLSRASLATAVRAEASLWVAIDDLDRKRDPTAAIAATDAVWADRGDLDEDVRRLLVTTRATALARLGRTAEARQVEAEVRVVTAAPRPTPVDQVLRRRREARVSGVAWATIALFGLATLPRVRRGLAARPRPWGLVPIWLGVVGASRIANLWEAGAGAALPAMGVGFTVVHLLALLGRPPDAGRARRVVVGLLAAAATLSVAWLALLRTHTLSWVGL